MQAELQARPTQEERTRKAKRRLRESALHLFAAQGYEATNLGAISLKAGFSRTLAQYHYPDKKTLALELLQERILRDNHVHLVQSSPNDEPIKAWNTLLTHLATLKDYYVQMHAGEVPNVKANGEMAIHAAAFISKDPEFRTCVEEQSRDQVKRIEQLLEICRKGKLIPDSTNVRGLAILYVQSIWSLAQALYTSPFARDSIGEAFDQLSYLFASLRREVEAAA